METRHGPGARALAWAVRLYQAARAGRPSPCRYWPSCSDYALDALREYGAAGGSWLTLRRLARCHPWGGSGVDPVPVPLRVPVSIRSVASRGGR